MTKKRNEKLRFSAYQKPQDLKIISGKTDNAEMKNDLAVDLISEILIPLPCLMNIIEISKDSRYDKKAPIGIARRPILLFLIRTALKAIFKMFPLIKDITGTPTLPVASRAVLITVKNPSNKTEGARAARNAKPSLTLPFSNSNARSSSEKIRNTKNAGVVMVDVSDNAKSILAE